MSSKQLKKLFAWSKSKKQLNGDAEGSTSSGSMTPTETERPTQTIRDVQANRHAEAGSSGTTYVGSTVDHTGRLLISHQQIHAQSQPPNGVSAPQRLLPHPHMSPARPHPSQHYPVYRIPHPQHVVPPQYHQMAPNQAPFLHPQYQPHQPQQPMPLYQYPPPYLHTHPAQRTVRRSNPPRNDQDPHQYYQQQQHMQHLHHQQQQQQHQQRHYQQLHQHHHQHHPQQPQQAAGSSGYWATNSLPQSFTYQRAPVLHARATHQRVVQLGGAGAELAPPTHAAGPGAVQLLPADQEFARRPAAPTDGRARRDPPPPPRHDSLEAPPPAPLAHHAAQSARPRCSLDEQQESSLVDRTAGLLISHARPGRPGSPRRGGDLNASLCVRCRRSIDSRAVLWKTRFYHKECFTCDICCKPVLEKNFQEDDKAMVVYHINCYSRNFLPACRICAQPIRQDEDGCVRYNKHPFFGDKYCLSHKLDTIPSCSSCTRLKEKHVSFAQLGDQRYVCIECLGSVLLDTKDAQPLYDQVLEFLSKHKLVHQEKLPLYLVDQDTLLACSKLEGVPSEDVQGLCIAHDCTIHVNEVGTDDVDCVPSQLLAAKMYRGFHGMFSVFCNIDVMVIVLGDWYNHSLTEDDPPSKHDLLATRSQATRPSLTGYQILQVGMRDESILRRDSCPVSAILVLYGYPWLKTGSIIAQECMRVYLRHATNSSLSQVVEGSLCLLMALLWLTDVVPKKPTNFEDIAEPWLIETGNFFAFAIKSDAAPVYADGLAAALAAYHHYGNLNNLLEHVCRTGQIPDIQTDIEPGCES